MKPALRRLLPAAAAAIAIVGASAGRADDVLSTYVVHKLTSDLPGASTPDPNLKNPWGIAFSGSGSPFWISDNATGLSTLYNGDGTIVPLVVTIPGPNGSPPGFTAAPTGIVWNPGTSFVIPGTGSPGVPAAFIFATEDGTISAWARGLTPPDAAVLAVDNSPGAVYKGLAFGVNVNGAFLFATNFRAGTVDVFDHNFQPAATDGGFQDPSIPPGYAPFGIQNINGDLWVSYARQNAAKHDDVAGAGHGFVDVFDTDGHLLKNFAAHGSLNSPWGIARASFAFGSFSGDILVGNFGNGRVNVFDSQGNFLGHLTRPNGEALVIPGLWSLTLGGGALSSSDTLYFTAGPNGESDGLFGTITPR
jgi:uncharacterized protein (TIGR03118 family)